MADGEDEERATRAGAAGAAGPPGARPALSPALPASRELPLFAELPELSGQVPWRPLAHAPTPVVPVRRDRGVPRARRRLGEARRSDLAALRRQQGASLRVPARRRGAAQREDARPPSAGWRRRRSPPRPLRPRARLRRHRGPVRSADHPVRPRARSSPTRPAAPSSSTAAATRPPRSGAIRALRRADRPYFILPGASSALPCLGYVDAMLELAEQVQRGEVPGRSHRRPLGDGRHAGGAHAGRRGARLADHDRRCSHHRAHRVELRRRPVRDRQHEAPARPARARFTRRRLPPVRFEIDHRAIGPGYGMPTPSSIAAIPEVERLIGVPGEVTYSAKASPRCADRAGAPAGDDPPLADALERAAAARGGRSGGAPAGVRAVLRRGDRVPRARRVVDRAAPWRHFRRRLFTSLSKSARAPVTVFSGPVILKNQSPPDGVSAIAPRRA